MSQIGNISEGRTQPPKKAKTKWASPTPPTLLQMNKKNNTADNLVRLPVQGTSWTNTTRHNKTTASRFLRAGRNMTRKANPKKKDRVKKTKAPNRSLPATSNRMDPPKLITSKIKWTYSPHLTTRAPLWTLNPRLRGGQALRRPLRQTMVIRKNED